ncbi:MAG: hypothetical protein B6D38_05855 [Anaerolineae bacterium UTCFX1]|nr:MAG: hypothetical protein B6D38_05855 [Anaerolineae bacterium UTCFX1]
MRGMVSQDGRWLLPLPKSDMGIGDTKENFAVGFGEGEDSGFMKIHIHVLPQLCSSVPRSLWDHFFGGCPPKVLEEERTEGVVLC